MDSYDFHSTAFQKENVVLWESTTFLVRLEKPTFELITYFSNIVKIADLYKLTTHELVDMLISLDIFSKLSEKTHIFVCINFYTAVD